MAQKGIIVVAHRVRIVGSITSRLQGAKIMLVCLFDPERCDPMMHRSRTSRALQLIPRKTRRSFSKRTLC